MMVNLNCQLYWIESFLGDTLLGMSTRVFPEGPHPPRVGGTISWTGVLDRESNGTPAEQRHSFLPISRL